MSYYYYRTYFGKKSRDDYQMFITPEGISFEYRDGRVFTSIMEPSKMFPNQTKLSRSDINAIHRFIKAQGNKYGKWHTKKEMEKMYERYLKETK